MPELNEALRAEILQLCERGENLADEGRLAEALDEFWSAWDRLPEPRTAWDAATSIMASIGDLNFQQGDFAAGRDHLGNAMHCPNAIGNPFLHLRLGQCQFELGNARRAADELARAFLLEGPKLFEEEDPKYLQFVLSKLTPPPGGWERYFEDESAE